MSGKTEKEQQFEREAAELARRMKAEREDVYGDPERDVEDELRHRREPWDLGFGWTR
jgi:hypothetical protein